jgi:ABC exporter DevB family membrane fusion protein
MVNWKLTAGPAWQIFPPPRKEIRAAAMTIGRTFCVLVAGSCVAAMGYAVSYWYPFPRPGVRPPTQGTLSEPHENPTRIEAQGRLEPASGTLAVGAIPGEEIVQLNAHVGQAVKKDEVLAVLGSLELRIAERVLAEEQLEKAKRQFEAEQSVGKLRQDVAQISQQQAESRKKEIPPQESIRVAEQRLALAETQLKKLEQLRNDPQTQEAIAEAELEQQRLLIRQIQLELDANRVKLEMAQQTQELAQRAAALDVAIAQTTQDNLVKASPLPVLQQSVELAKLAEKISVVRSPCDGTILEVYSRQGEHVANTPILQVGDLRQMVCVAEVHEENLKDLEVNAVPDSAGDGKLVPARDYVVTIRSAALEQDLHGKVVEIGRLIGAPALRDPNPLAQTDRRTVRIRIELDEASTAIARRFVQLQVNVSINLQ